MQRIKVILSWAIIVSTFLVSGYFSVVGFLAIRINEIVENASKEVVNEGKGITFNGFYYDNYEQFYADQEVEKFQNLIPEKWLSIPETLMFMLAAIAFGFFGATGLVLKKTIIQKKNPADTKLVALPILGGFVGFIVLGISFLVPTILSTGETEIRPISLLFLCLFGGFSTERFFNWLDDKINEVYNKGKVSEE